MKLCDILNGIDVIECNADLESEILGVECDSRKATEKTLFVAIKGYETDGNKYIASAKGAGASVYITDEKNALSKDGILVSDARRALAVAAKNFYGNPTKDIKVIGVTGTNGKTTVTYLIKHILEKQGAICGLIGTNKNMIGEKTLETERTTPESNELWKLFSEMRDAGCTHIIMEVSSHSLELSRVYGIEYTVGAFTNLTQDHLDFHKTMENYEAAKLKLFNQCEIGVINIDDEAGKRISKLAPSEVITYSAKSNEGDYVAKNIRTKPASVEFEFVGIDTIARMEMNIPGKFSVYNALCAISVLMALGVPVYEISAALRTVKGVKGRAEVVPTETDYTVMIDYAHSPDGLENILRTVKEITEGKVYVVFGCGGDRDATKRPKMGKVAASLADVVIVTSDNPRTEDPNLIINDIIPGVREVRDDFISIADRREAIFKALDMAGKGDMIVLAGKGHETYQEINHIKHHMDEREIVQEYFSGR
ncbi:MAG: UDP-N-acetylmuramoyl-L-alanyl-D-glutamate--2,6-diaminopimelate ligase [Oscillospiraceae bacterium]|nr:UDP-N-acetylmuramoyl-L-alanyl-D-glutamate--2,6-diaminopimelate ligase [Oscillospiraceae bacterium]MBQ7119244.1 UDP-N-acetylmuramoyl-L-alanyl-D-glutamate--2,6-diaminopimelate ligase [Oscillospiraceae bacterium]